MNLSFSIIVCCYNSTTRLLPTLTHLANLDYPSASLELILVDNASKDDTAQFAANTWSSLGNPYTYKPIYEAEAGLIHARKAGIKEAKKDYVLFVDDDNWIGESYLKEAYQILEQNPKIGVLGGKITGEFETPPPKWMTPPKPFKSLIGNLAIHTDAHKYGLLEGKKDYVFGAGSFYKRESLQQIFQEGIIPLLSGRSKGVLTSGDDVELCIMMRLLGYDLYRSDKLQMKHFITANRLEWEYFQRLYFGFGYADWIIQFYHYYLEHNTHQSLADIINTAPIHSKKRSFNQYAQFMGAFPFGEQFKKNKFHLLASYEEGKLKFLEQQGENIPHIQATIADYCQRLKRMSN